MSARDDQTDTDQHKEHTFEGRHLLDRFTLGFVFDRRTDQEDQITDKDDQQADAHPAL